MLIRTRAPEGEVAETAQIAAAREQERMAESEQQFGTTGTPAAQSGTGQSDRRDDRQDDRQERPSWEGRVLPANTRREAPLERVDDSEDHPEHPARTPAGTALWFWWTVATVLGWSLAAVGFAAFFDLETDAMWWYAFVPLTALFQWLLIRRHFARASWWLLATTAGAATAALIFAVLLILPEATFGPPTSGLRLGISDLTDGFALGLAQWLVLRRSVRGAERWIPATVSPLALFGWLDFQRGRQAAEVLDFLTRPERIAVAAANNGIAGLLIGALTGALLMRLVEEPRE